ncbi:CWF19-like protein 1 [Neocloeon triangulifer]|uniref:CWF19-like protein 1 n=1 Tax=Neocloeon triangulifer TaxID=2078957 RepID=UPI00286EFFAC|nr:CWF19-like protein 1 [Neocloeon triangulifer]
MAEKFKILVCGDVNGKFNKLFSRIESINAKNGPFDYLFCVGNFFGDRSSSAEWNLYKNGTFTVPIPTCIIGPSDPKQLSHFTDPNGCELCPNVNYLGKRGLFSSSEGLKIAYLSGKEGAKSDSCTFTAEDVSAVRDSCLRNQSNYKGVDILLTSQWPQGGKDGQEGSALISWLAVQIKPRYHFCGLKSFFFERAPYRNHDTGDNVDLPTRLIALSSVGQKDKWVYALNIQPVIFIPQGELAQRTTDETPCPYPNSPSLPGATGNKREGPSQFFYDMDAAAEMGAGKKKQRRETDEERQQRLANQAPCWFCLSSPQVEKHMVISVGTEVYLALAKGGLTPDHVLILPVTHHQAASQLPPEVTDEVKKFKSALKKFFKKRHNKAVIFFERNYRTSHMQVQAVPIPASAAPDAKAAFQECAEEKGLHLTELPDHSDLSQVAPSGTPYFHVELPSGDQLYMTAKKNFPLQFGREALVGPSLLDMPEKVDWKDCQISQEEEKANTVKFREEFEPFDFTI